MPKVKLEISGKAIPVTADCQIEGSTFSVRIDDQMFQGTWVTTGPGEGWLSCHGKIVPFYMAQQHEKLSIWLGGQAYQLSLISGGPRRAGEAGSAGLQGGDVKAPMPGTVLKVLVQAGDIVEPNQPLVIMESMKMEMTLSSPTAATVQQINGSAGQLVEMGTVLVKLTPIESPE
jgi:3-methylcrotonyl-CoA carboxylase alpha subunit